MEGIKRQIVNEITMKIYALVTSATEKDIKEA